MENKSLLVTVGLILTSFVLKSSGLPADFCDTVEPVEFLPHPDDCTKYVLCILGTPTILECGPNQVFSITSGRCEPGN